MFPSYRRNKNLFVPSSFDCCRSAICTGKISYSSASFSRSFTDRFVISSKRSASFTCSHSYICFARNGFSPRRSSSFVILHIHMPEYLSSFSYFPFSFFVSCHFTLLRVLPFHPFSAFRHFQTSFFRNRAIKNPSLL